LQAVCASACAELLFKEGYEEEIEADGGGCLAGYRSMFVPPLFDGSENMAAYLFYDVYDAFASFCFDMFRMFGPVVFCPSFCCHFTSHFSLFA
jgi:hypothetical protein